MLRKTEGKKGGRKIRKRKTEGKEKEGRKEEWGISAMRGDFSGAEDVRRGARDRERGRTWGEITGQREEGTHRGVALEGADTGTCFSKLSVLPCTYHFVKFFWISKGVVLKVN